MMKLEMSATRGVGLAGAVALLSVVLLAGCSAAGQKGGPARGCGDARGGGGDPTRGRPHFRGLRGADVCAGHGRGPGPGGRISRALAVPAGFGGAGRRRPLCSGSAALRGQRAAGEREPQAGRGGSRFRPAPGLALAGASQPGLRASESGKGPAGLRAAQTAGRCRRRVEAGPGRRRRRAQSRRSKRARLPGERRSGHYLDKDADRLHASEDGGAKSRVARPPS